MATFKHKKGGTCTVYSLENIEKLRRDEDYTEIKPAEAKAAAPEGTEEAEAKSSKSDK